MTVELGAKGAGISVGGTAGRSFWAVARVKSSAVMLRYITRGPLVVVAVVDIVIIVTIEVESFHICRSAEPGRWVVKALLCEDVSEIRRAGGGSLTISDHDILGQSSSGCEW